MQFTMITVADHQNHEVVLTGPGFETEEDEADFSFRAIDDWLFPAEMAAVLRS